MKTSKIIAAAALSMLAAVGAQAETYEGVHPLVSANDRAQVSVQAARIGNPYAEAISSQVAPVLNASTDRSTVRNEAYAAVRSANPYAEGYGQGVVALQNSRVDRAAIRAEARDAARGVNQLAL